MNNFSIQSIVDAKLTERREPRGVTSWQCGKLGSCLTGVYLERLGVPPDEEFDARTLRVFSAGKMFEQWVIDLAKGDKDIKYTEQPRVEIPELDVTGYADLVIEKDGEKILYEIKSKNSRAFWYMNKQKEGANNHHRMQTWLYLKALGIQDGRILYLEKDTLTTLEYPVRLDDKELEKEVLGELAILNAAWEQKLPPPIPEWETKDKWKSNYCRWHKKCVACEKYLDLSTIKGYRSVEEPTPPEDDYKCTVCCRPLLACKCD